MSRYVLIPTNFSPISTAADIQGSTVPWRLGPLPSLHFHSASNDICIITARIQIAENSSYIAISARTERIGILPSLGRTRLLRPPLGPASTARPPGASASVRMVLPYHGAVLEYPLQVSVLLQYSYRYRSTILPALPTSLIETSRPGVQSKGCRAIE